MLNARLHLLAESYQRLTGRPLLPELLPPFRGKAGMGVEVQDHSDSFIPSLSLPLKGGGDELLREALWNAPQVIVAHGTEADPVFFYGNRLALELFEMSFEEFVRLPSRFSAEPLERGERERLLNKVAEQGYVDDYRGVRVSSSGRRFLIEQATVWNLVDGEKRPHGQAATFTDWHYLED